MQVRTKLIRKVLYHFQTANFTIVTRKLNNINKYICGHINNGEYECCFMHYLLSADIYCR